MREITHRVGFAVWSICVMLLPSLLVLLGSCRAKSTTIAATGLLQGIDRAYTQSQESEEVSELLIEELHIPSDTTDSIIMLPTMNVFPRRQHIRRLRLHKRKRSVLSEQQDSAIRTIHTTMIKPMPKARYSLWGYVVVGLVSFVLGTRIYAFINRYHKKQ